MPMRHMAQHSPTTCEFAHIFVYDDCKRSFFAVYDAFCQPINVKNKGKKERSCVVKTFYFLVGNNDTEVRK